MMARVGVSVLVLAVIALVSMHAQGRPTPAPATGAALMTGQIFDAATGVPVSTAIVELAGAGKAPARSPRVLTDAGGRFFFDNIAPGSYTVTATKPGWIPGASGRRRPEGPAAPVEIHDGDRIGNIAIPLWRYAVITGRVSDQTGDPLIGTDVRFFQQSITAGRRGWTFTGRALTDDRGIYRAANLMPGSYLVVVPATVTSEPASLRGIRQTPDSYLQTMTAVDTAPMSLDRSDIPASAGQVMVGSLLTVPKLPGTEPWLTYQTTLFPSATTVSEASRVRAVTGREQSGVDIIVRLSPTFEISGAVTLPDGSPASFHAVHLLPADSANAPLFDAATAVTDAGGAFTFYGVAAGQYIARVVRTPRPAGDGVQMGICGGTGAIRFVCVFGGGPTSRPRPSDDPLLFVDQPVTVSARSVRNVSLRMQAGHRVTGAALFDGTSARPTAAELAEMHVVLERADGGVPRPAGGFDTTIPGDVSPDGTFATASTKPGRYFLRTTNPPAPWRVRSATYRGQDVSETSFDLTGDASDVVITFTDRSTTIEGTVQSEGSADSASTILLFPIDAARWVDYGRTSRRVQSAVTSGGRFTLPAPPEGDYYLVAIASEDTTEWQEPSRLERLAAIAERITVTDGSGLTQTLKTRRLP